MSCSEKNGDRNWGTKDRPGQLRRYRFCRECNSTTLRKRQGAGENQARGGFSLPGIDEKRGTKEILGDSSILDHVSSWRRKALVVVVESEFPARVRDRFYRGASCLRNSCAVLLIRRMPGRTGKRSTIFKSIRSKPAVGIARCPFRM